MKHLLNWLGPLILIGTLLVSIPRYAAAFIQAEPTIFNLPTAPITGLGFGLLLELGIYYVIDSWFDARRRGLKFHWVLLVGVAAQLVLGPVIVAPAIVGHLRAAPGELGKVLDGDIGVWAWATVVAAAPALLLAAVAAASFMREPISNRKQPEPDRKEPERAPEQAIALPAWLTVLPESKGHFVELVRSGVVKLPEAATGYDLIPVAGSDRSGRSWLKAAREARNGDSH